MEAHPLFAGAGMQSLCCGLLDGKHDLRNAGSRPQGSTEAGGLYVGPMHMVVMEHVGGSTGQSGWSKGAREKVREAIQKLHDAALVFGDLRTPNVMFPGDKAFLINFEWAGNAGEARYPRNLSRSVKWPEKAEELEMKPIFMDHDWFMFNQLFPE